MNRTCTKCGRELPGVSLDFVTDNWLCAECANDQTNPVFCRHGDTVTYAHTNATKLATRILGNKYLTPGTAYTVDDVIVGKQETHIKLHGINVWFNSVLFNRVPA